MDQTKERIYDGLRLLLSAGGPFSAVILRYTEMNESDWNLWVQLALFVVPPAGAWVWGLYLNSIKKKGEAIAAAPKDDQLQVLQMIPVEVKGEAIAAAPKADQLQALQALPEDVKIGLAEKIPGVATVVVKDNVNGTLARMAASEANPKVVTETQNEYDAKLGTKVQV